MPLSAGTRLGPYEILAPLGAGGMGEVYRAKDTKLERDVAIKILPAALARDPERLARFEREAKVLASLNHPNIAQIYGLEGGADHRALIMELVEGRTLGQVKTPVPLETVLDYAGQIANALSAAHEKGITHRDLKPANLMVTPEGVIKVLDFGLAAQNRESSSAGGENSPTLTMGSTQAGVILGTAAYMSPEQASGQPVDRRSDIWSFGVVLLELLTGQRVFTGDTISHLLAAVLTKEPDVERAPMQARRLLRACLQRDPKQRLQAIGDWRLLIDPAAPVVVQESAPPAKSRTPVWALVAAGFLAIALGAVTWMWLRASRPVDRPLIRASVDLGPDTVAGLRTTAALSPDGTRIVFPVRGPNGVQLAMRLLSEANTTLLPGTDDGSDPFFKPDGQWIGFVADRKLKKVSVLGGVAVTICDAASPRGAAWGEDDNIIFTPLATPAGLMRVPASGGTPQPLTKPEDNGEQSHRWPQILPGGKAVLFTGGASTASFENARVEALTLKTGKIRVLESSGFFGRYIAKNQSDGYLVYIYHGVLFGVPFDPDRLETRGTPTPMVEDVSADASTGAGQFDAAAGTLMYRAGKATGSAYTVAWMDSTGKTEPIISTPGDYFTPRVSPDGKQLAISVGSANGDVDLYLYDSQRDALSKLTFNGKNNFNPVWSPDGKHIAFRSSPAGDTGETSIWWIRSDGAGEPRLLYRTKTLAAPTSFSPDGRRLAMEVLSLETNMDIWTMPLDLSDPEHPKPGTPEKFFASPKLDALPMFSPDGRWIAYVSDEAGRPDVFVRPFPGPGGVWQVSGKGGVYPVWSRDGKLFYRSLSNTISVADYTAKGDTFTVGKSRVWSETATRSAGGNALTPLDLAPDGKRFAIFPLPAVQDQKASVHVTFLFNFLDELRRRMPGN